MAIDESALLAAVVAIAEQDTGAGGLVDLLGTQHPAVEWGDEGMNRRPITAVEIDPDRYGRGTGRSLSGLIRLNAFVPRASAGLESTILNRWETILTAPALLAEGINGIIRWTGRPDLTDLETSGKRRALEGTFTITRS